MPHNDETLRTIGQAIRTVDTDVISLLKESKLHDYIDDIQLDLADINNSIATSWFGYQASEDILEQIEWCYFELQYLNTKNWLAVRQKQRSPSLAWYLLLHSYFLISQHHASQMTIVDMPPP